MKVFIVVVYGLVSLLTYFQQWTLASTIISSTPITYTESGKQYAKQRVQVLCTDELPFSFDIQREGSAEVDTVTVTCSAPEILYNSQLWSYVPLSTSCSTLPIVVQPNRINMTEKGNDYVKNKIYPQTVKQTIHPPAPPDPRNLLPMGGGGKSKNNQSVALLSNAAKKDPHKLHGFILNILKRRLLQAPVADEGDEGQSDIFKREADLTSWQDIHKQQMGENIVRDLLIGGGFAAIADFALGMFGTSANDKIMKNIEIITKDINDLFTDVANIVELENKFEYQTNVILGELNQRDDSIEHRQDEDEKAIRYVQNQTNSIVSFTEALKESTDRRFGSVQGEIQQLSGGSVAIANVFEKLDKRETDRHKLVIGALERIISNIEVAFNAIDSIRYKKEHRRVTSLYFHSALKNLTDPAYSAGDGKTKLGKNLPFMVDIGVPPLTLDERQALRTLDSAVVMATIEIQGTQVQNSVSAGGGGGGAHTSTTIARSIEVSILCDQTFIANITSSSVTLDWIVRAIGPHTDAQPNCWSPWICNCIFRVNSTLAQRSSSGQAVYPFGSNDFKGSISKLRREVIETQFPGCTSETFALPTGGCTTHTNPVYFDVVADFQDYMKSILCQSSSTWLENKYRVVSPSLGRSIDLTFNPLLFANGTDDMCDTNYLTAPNGTAANAMYRYFQREFALHFPAINSYLDQVIYGKAGQLTSREFIGSRYPQLMDAYFTIVISFCAILARSSFDAPRMLPVHVLTREDTRFSVTVGVNSQPTFDAQLGGLSTSVPFNDSQFGTMSISTDNTIASIKGESLLLDSMLWIGPEYEYTSDNYFHLTGNPMTPRVVYDFDHDRLRIGNAASRKGLLNYLEIRKSDILRNNPNFPFGEGMPFNQSDWSYYEKADFDAESATDTPSENMWVVDPDSNTCDEWVNPDDLDETIPASAALPFKSMCSIREQFLVPLAWNPRIESQQVSFGARSFAFTVLFEIPKGAILAEGNSVCPDARFNPGVGSQPLLVNSQSDRSISFRYSICPSKTDNTQPTLCIRSGQSPADILTIGPLATYSVPFSIINVDYFLQAWPIHDLFASEDNICFGSNGGQGLLLNKQFNFSFSPSMNHNIQREVVQLIEARQVDTVLYMTALAQSVGALTQLILSSQQNNDLGLEAVVIAQSIQRQINATKNIADDPELDAQMDQLNQIMSITNKGVDQAMQQASFYKNQSDALSLQIQTNLNISIGYQQALNKSIEHFQRDLDDFKKTIDKLGIAPTGGGFGLGFLGDLLDGILSIFSLPSLGSGLNTLITFFIIGVVCVCMCMCCKAVYSSTSK